MSGPKRRELIQAIQDIIVRACPVAESFAYETIALWSAGGHAETPVEKAVFQVIDELVSKMDADTRERAEDLEEAGELADKLDQDLEDYDEGGEA